MFTYLLSQIVSELLKEKYFLSFNNKEIYTASLGS